MIRADARLRAILVNFNGGELLERAVMSLKASQWPGELDVVVVDNASTDGSLAAIENVTDVHIIHNESNDGFSANNLGIADLLGDEISIDVAEPEIVALLNPDAFVRPEALRRLAAELDPAKKMGVASPTIVFDRPFVECEISTNGDPVLIDEISCGGRNIAAQCHGVDGAERFPGDLGPVWRCPNGSMLRIPIAALGDRIIVSVARGSGVIDGQGVAAGDDYEIDVATRRTHRIVQNAGIFVDAVGVGHSRGFAQRIEDSLGPAAPLWTGAAVVFHADFFREVGGFDPEYFLYYEDVELGLRGLAHGWTTLHVPDAIVEHRHSDRSVQGTELVEVLQHRNRLLTQVRHGSAGDVVKTFGRASLTPLSIAASAVRSPGERKERLRLARWRAQAFGDAVKGLPKARQARGEISRDRNVDTDEVRRISRRRR